MLEGLKKILTKYVFIVILLIGIPSLAFWSLFFTAGIPLIDYAINTIAGCLTIVFLVWAELYVRTKSKMIFIIGMIFFILMTFVAYYSINWISQETMNISLTGTHLAQAGFSCIFGVCVALAFRIIIFKDKKSNWDVTMNKYKVLLKDIFRKYGYYFSLIFFLIGIFFIIISELIKRGDFNIISDSYSNLLLTSGFGFITVGIAFISIKIAIDSDYKIYNIANANFLRVLSRFEDRRLDLQFPNVRQEGMYPNIVIWKGWVDINEMKELLEFCDIKEGYQRKMMNLQCQFLRVINHNYHSILMCEGVKHLLQISDIVLNLKPEFQDLRTELFSHIRNLFDNYGEEIDDNEHILEIQPLLENYPEDINANKRYIDYMIQLLNELNFIKFLDIREQFKIWFEEEHMDNNAS